MSVFRWTAALYDRVIDFLALLSGLFVAVTIPAVCYDVVGRYFVNKPEPWVGTLSEISLPYVAFLPAAWLLKVEGHVMVDVIYDRVGRKPQAFLDIATSALGAAASFGLTWFAAIATWENAQAGIQMVGITPYPKWLLLAPVPIGGLLVAIQFLRRTYGFWLTRSSRKQGDQPTLVLERGGV